MKRWRTQATLNESEGALLAREAWEAWCENEAAFNDALEARAARYSAKAATSAVHQAILAARGYRYYDRQRMQSPELTEARGAERAAEVTEQRAWNYAHEVNEWAADILSLYFEYWARLPAVAVSLGGGQVEPFSVGDRVRHRIHGVGRVCAVDGPELMVEFHDAHGMPCKVRLITEFARLEPA